MSFELIVNPFLLYVYYIYGILIMRLFLSENFNFPLYK
nr:MAG TPA: hypothetical protein [Caudoviricetes sp.]